MAPGPSADEWVLSGPAGEAAAPGVWRRCANFHSAACCNWLVRAEDAHVFCHSCRLTRTIPDLSRPESAARWEKLEAAKRRLAAQLLELKLPVVSRADDPQHGVAFDFLETLPGGPRILTSHADGLITINAEEADDAIREKMRAEMREPYRTLLGHFRHEIGHYYWDRLVEGTPWLEKFRHVFGDERADYAAALEQNYHSGPPPDWAMRHVSAYASVHPWEDWAETWAHYLHIVDTINTALGYGLGGNDVDFNSEPFAQDALYDPSHAQSGPFLALINSWVELTAVLNELTRSMGQRDLYPFVLSKAAVAKLHFVHLVVSEAGEKAAAAER